MTAQHFAEMATLAGLKEVRAGQLAEEKSSNPQVRNFAMQLVKDHSRANEELQRLAQSKGIMLPPTNSFAKGAHGSDRQLVRGKEDATTSNRSTRNSNTGTSTSGTGTSGANAGTSGTSTGGAETRENMHAMAQQSIDRLEGLSKEEFDRAFIQEMVQDHRKAVDKFDQASKNLNDPELKAFAAKHLPTLRDHLSEAQKLWTSTGGAGGGREKPSSNK
jgi:putative membrane protein